MELERAWTKLSKWSMRNIKDITTCDFIGIPLDNPNYVDEYPCRYDVCVKQPEDCLESDSDI